MKLVYICSPFRGDYEQNIIKAQGYCKEAINKGVLPVAPHVYFPQFLDDSSAEERGLGIYLGVQLLAYCKEVWVFGMDNPSEGMQLEIECAQQCGIPVIDAAEVLRQ